MVPRTEGRGLLRGCDPNGPTSLLFICRCMPAGLIKEGSSRKCVLAFFDEGDPEGEIASLAVAIRAPFLDFDFVVQSFQGTAAYAEQQPVENVPTMGSDGLSEPHHRTDGRGSSLPSPIVQVLRSQVLASFEVATTSVPGPSQPPFEKASVANRFIQHP